MQCFCYAWCDRQFAERLATEIRHLQRTEVREANFLIGPEGIVGDAAQRNPVLTSLTGARIVRAAVIRH